MINFDFHITNPWSTRWHILYSRCLRLTQHLYCEFAAYRTHSVIDCVFRFTVKGDHPGLSLQLGVLGYSLALTVYDSRHDR